jgi:hypothetical protein
MVLVITRFEEAQLFSGIKTDEPEPGRMREGARQIALHRGIVDEVTVDPGGSESGYCRQNQKTTERFPYHRICFKTEQVQANRTMYQGDSK